MDVWRRSFFYRAWVVLGFVAVVAVTVVNGSQAAPGDDAPLRTGVIAVAIYIGGIVVLQGLRLAGDRKTGGVPPEQVALIQQMALRPMTEAQVRKTATETSNLAFAGFVFAGGTALATVAGGLLYANDTWKGELRPFGDSGPALPYAFIPLVVIVLLALVRLPGQIKRGRQIGDAWLKPLGLLITGLPHSTVLPNTGGYQHHVIGSTTMTGERHGRHVVVDIAAGESTVVVRGATVPFAAKADRGSFSADGPAAAVLHDVGSASQWDRLTITGGPDGVLVTRKGQPASWAWLADLWLAERLQDSRLSATPEPV